MLSCDKYTAQYLPKADEDAWRDMLASTPEFASPLLSPEFFKAVANVRDDVYVAVFREGAKAVGFLAHHKRPGHFARPCGAPFADYSALITHPHPRFKASQALDLAGIDQFQAIGLVDPYAVFGKVNGEDDIAYGMSFCPTMPASPVNKKHAKNINRNRRHLIDTHGDISFIFDDKNQTHFDFMIELKRKQLIRTGLHDFLSAPWVKQFYQNLRHADQSGLHGFMLTMKAANVPLMFQFGVRLGDRAHPWISSYDPAYARFSPGQIYLIDCHKPLIEGGICYYDLSTGQQHYKESFCNTQFSVKHVRLYGGTKRAKRGHEIARLSANMSKRLGGGIDNLVSRLNRRMDHIACVELDIIGRARGLTHALTSASKRIKTSQAQ